MRCAKRIKLAPIHDGGEDAKHEPAGARRLHPTADVGAGGSIEQGTLHGLCSKLIRLPEGGHQAELTP